MNSSNLRSKTFFSILWCYVGKFGSQIMAIVPAMILARILGPDQYGLLAITAIFTGIAYQLADAGFGNALIQKKQADNLDYNTVFYFNIFFCGLIYLLIYFSAPIIAHFFNEVLLCNVIRLSSIGLLILSFGSIQTIIFKKELNYRSQVIRDLLCQLLSISIAVLLALKGYGVWALVWQGITITTSTVICNWFMSPWRPQFTFSFNRLLSLFGFGSKTMLSGLIDYGFIKAYDLVIGKCYSPTSLGLYNRAYSTADIFKSTFFGVFSGVTFPLFVQMQDDNERLLKNIRKFLQIISLVIFTIMGVVIALSDPIFQFMYSNKWNGAIGMFRIACCMAMIIPIISVLESIILAKGFSGKFLKISIIRKLFVVAIIASIWKYGVIWLMVGQLAVSICECLIYIIVTKRIVGYGLYSLLLDIIPTLLIAIIIFISTFCADYIFTSILQYQFSKTMLLSLSRIIFGIIVAFVVFVAVCKTSRNRVYSELLQFIEDSIGPYKYISFFKF